MTVPLSEEDDEPEEGPGLLEVQESEQVRALVLRLLLQEPQPHTEGNTRVRRKLLVVMTVILVRAVTADNQGPCAPFRPLHPACGSRFCPYSS
jgi:hypothetical protein